MNVRDYLFLKHDWFYIQENNKGKLTKEISNYNGNKLLNTPTEDLCEYFLGKYQLNTPVIHIDNAVADQQETKVDVSKNPNRYVTDRNHPFYIPGTKITIIVPFDGYPFLFDIKPSQYTLSPPRAIIEENQLIFEYEGINLQSESIKTQFDNTIKEIKEYLSWLSHDIEGYNSSLSSIIHLEIENRKTKLLKDQSLVAALGFSLKQRSDDNMTYAAPQVRRKILPSPPLASVTPYTPEPVLLQDHYEHILKVLEDMALVMERSPRAFVSLKEEDLRTHFLVQLNGHFEGNATGETFNFSGKTDILIRVNEKNIFIGECKFWNGTKKLMETINQLLGYSSWRDTKTAIILFNKKKNFSNVLKTIPSTIEAHPNYKRTLPQLSDTRFQYVFGHREDSNRELIMTILAFDVPTEIS
jgi:hypothetical protein